MPKGTIPMRRCGLRLSALAFCALASLPLWTISTHGGTSDESVTNLFLGQPDAIEAGKQIYRSKCYICHHSSGARGPDLFATKLSDERFLEIVINGRKGTQMPAFGLRLSPDEVWQVHAYVKSTDHY
jgi:mono/diheme cytochrome c family protein